CPLPITPGASHARAAEGDVGQHGGGRDLDAALLALIDAALRRADDATAVPLPERARLLTQALAAGLRELIRAPLREALQAGYDLGWRAAQDAQRQTTPDTRVAPPGPPLAAGVAPGPGQSASAR